jgi:hypothetical protein
LNKKRLYFTDAVVHTNAPIKGFGQSPDEIANHERTLEAFKFFGLKDLIKESAVAIETKCMKGSAHRGEIGNDLRKWEGTIESGRVLVVFFWGLNSLIVAKYVQGRDYKLEVASAFFWLRKEGQLKVEALAFVKEYYQDKTGNKTKRLPQMIDSVEKDIGGRLFDIDASKDEVKFKFLEIGSQLLNPVPEFDRILIPAPNQLTSGRVLFDNGWTRPNTKKEDKFSRAIMNGTLERIGEEGNSIEGKQFLMTDYLIEREDDGPCEEVEGEVEEEEDDEEEDEQMWIWDEDEEEEGEQMGICEEDEEEEDDDMGEENEEEEDDDMDEEEEKSRRYNGDY